LALSDVLFTSASKVNPTNSQTTGVDPSDQTRVSEFLTIQSLTNFAAITGALTVAWRALDRLDPNLFGSRWTPAVMAFSWFVVSIIATASQQEQTVRRSPGFWAPSIFIGIVNSLVLFSAVVGLS